MTGSPAPQGLRFLSQQAVAAVMPWSSVELTGYPTYPACYTDCGCRNGPNGCSASAQATTTADSTSCAAYVVDLTLDKTWTFVSARAGGAK